MSDRTRLAFTMLLPGSDPVFPDESEAFDAQLERQLTRLESLSSLSSIDDDADEWEDVDDIDRDL
jgi:hypothetical protein